MTDFFKNFNFKEFTNSVIRFFVSLVWSLIKMLTIIGGYVFLVAMDPILGIIVYPKLWPGAAGQNFPVLWMNLDANDIAMIVSVALSAIQMVLISKLIENIVHKKPLINNAGDWLRLIVAGFFALFDTFFDSLAGLILSGDWSMFLAGEYAVVTFMSWAFLLMFAVLSGLGEIAAEYIRETFDPSKA